MGIHFYFVKPLSRAGSIMKASLCLILVVVVASSVDGALKIDCNTCKNAVQQFYTTDMDYLQLHMKRICHFLDGVYAGFKWSCDAFADWNMPQITKNLKATYTAEQVCQHFEFCK